MSIVHDEYAGFQQFAEAKLRSENIESLDELFDLWRIEHPTSDEQADVHQSIQEGLADLRAGRFRSADEVNAELRAKYGF
jgi:predicted transcriptional regulator